MGRAPKKKEQYFIYIEGQKVEVTEEVYRVYYAGRNTEDYQQKRDEKNGLLYFSDMESEDMGSAEGLLVSPEISPERKISSDLLMADIRKTFSEKECEIIEGLYIRGLSMRELARNLSININALEKRRDRLLPKLKKFLQKYLE